MTRVRAAPDLPAARRRWAPWWVYLVVILAGGWLRQLAVPADLLPPWADAALGIGVAVLLAAVVTALARRRSVPPATPRSASR